MFFKNIFGLIVLFLLVIPFATADDVNFKFYRDSYKSFETVQVEVKLENITLSKDLGVQNLVLYDIENKSISLAKNIVKISNDFYVFYFDLPQLAEGSYFFGLNDVSYTKNGVSKFGDFFTNLNVVGGNTQVVSVRPAYVFTKVSGNQDTSFSLIINNKGSDNVDVVLDKEGDFFNLQQNSFSLDASASKSVNVLTSLGNNASFSGKIIVKYSDKFYEIPFVIERLGFVQKNIVEENKTIQIVEISNIKDPIYLTTLTDKRLESLDISSTIDEVGALAASQLIVKNNAGADLHEVKYSFSGDVAGMFVIEPLKHELIGADDNMIIQLSLNKDYNFVPGLFSGSFDIQTKEGAGLKLLINIEIMGVPEVMPENKTIETVVINKTVEQPPVEKKGVSPFLILLIVVVILSIILFFIYRKTRPKQKEFEAFVDRVKRN